MSAKIWRMIGLAGALALAGCGESEDAGSGGGGSGGAIGGSGGAAGGAGGAGGAAGGAGGGVPQVPAARAAGRMTIEQLARSIPVITDGLRWTEDFGDGPQDMLEVLAPTLGAPDYFLVVEESLEPSLIIAKFMQDAANRICVRWVARDEGLPLADRTLVQHEEWQSRSPALVQANIQRLMLRFFGRVVPDDDAQLADLVALFEAASEGAPAGLAAQDGWLSVCVALMTDPEFVIY